MRITENFNTEQRIIIDRILKDMWASMTEAKCKQEYEYLQAKLFLYQVPREVDYRQVLKSRLYGRIKWALLTCSIARLKKMEAEKKTDDRPYFKQIMTKI
jgi:hypothetical protein